MHILLDHLGGGCRGDWDPGTTRGARPSYRWHKREQRDERSHVESLERQKILGLEFVAVRLGIVAVGMDVAAIRRALPISASFCKKLTSGGTYVAVKSG